MSGGRYLVGLREIITSEKILQMRSLLKENFDFWKMDFKTFRSVVNINLISELFINDIQECD